jgi:hypothetical protein
MLDCYPIIINIKIHKGHSVERLKLLKGFIENTDFLTTTITTTQAG